MYHAEARKLIKYCIKRRKPFLLTGAPGVGKTTLVEEIAAEMDADYCLLTPVTSDPTDFKGIPAVVREGDREVAKFFPAGQIDTMLHARKLTLVFMDDLGHAIPATQGAAMHPLQALDINGVRISPYVTFGAATNRAGDRAGVGQIITPLLNRFSKIIPLEIDPEKWAERLMSRGGHAAVAAYTQWRPAVLQTFDPPKDFVNMPTGRSLEELSNTLLYGLTDLDSIISTIGPSVGTEFSAFMRIYESLPDLKTIYKDPEGVPTPSKADVKYALMAALANNMNKKNLKASLRFLDRVEEEFAVLCVRYALLRDPDLSNDGSGLISEWAIKHQGVLSLIEEE